MKREPQIGLRVGVPAFFAIELENEYRHNPGPHQAISFHGFLGYLLGLGLEQYRKGNPTAPIGKDEAQEENREGEPFHLFDIPREGLHDLFKEFDAAMEKTAEPSGPRLVQNSGDDSA